MILDGNDPSGLGIFSKAGRQYTQKIPILSRRKPAHLKKDFSIDSSPPLIDRSSTIQPGKNAIKVQPFQKIVSREKRMRVLEGINVNPVVGQYHPVIQNRPLMVWDYMHVYKKAQQNEETVKSRKFKNTLQLGFTTTSNQMSNMEGVSQKSVGHIDMSKMLGRQREEKKESSTMQGFSESSEMENPEYSRCHTEIKPHLKGSISFTKQLSREKANRKRTDPGLTYDCKFQYTKMSLGRVGPSFDKRVGRRNLLYKTYTMAGSCYNYDDYVWKGNSNIFPKTKVGLIDFEKQTRRREYVKMAQDSEFQE